MFFAGLVEQLLMKMDRELYDFFQELQMELIFCHRLVFLMFLQLFRKVKVKVKLRFSAQSAGIAEIEQT